ncbi:HlyD family efflux transporter periplasmic adaptor subunit [Phycicoccus sp. M110.8]|uniref:efflux RND transporter periplasmic adaptor subunit n=1 Tax=Phycicoccus sp. M110.8 TaxID=3075433 RepID=UPI0028FDA326|nr:HlyD family efflux transporter periplasmic adaptor subunit [Phycicoccus sp. M110.8]MDU0314745.1 HlyD family efflux transporter periplasmic adaptor subunit [Phycicoccus sp. M110.8]
MARRSPRRSRRWPVLAVAAVVVAALAVGAWLVLRPGASAGAATGTSILATATVGPVEESVSGTGTLAAAHQADLSFTVGGTVTSVRVTVGQHVRRGAVLATVDPSSLRAAVSVAEANLTAAEDAATAAASGTSAQLASADAQLAAAQGTLAQARANLSAATLTAPLDGVVAAVSIAPGDSVAAASGSSSSTGGGSGGSGGSSGGAGGGSGGGGGAAGTGSGSSAAPGQGASASASAGTGQVVVISPTSWVVDASVAAADLGKVKRGMQAQVLTTGSTQPVFGTVGSVGVMATSTSGGVATFPVTIDVTGNPPGLYAGTSVTTRIIYKQVQDVLTVPTAAVSQSGGRATVTVRQGGRDTAVPVTVGTVYGAQTQVLSGLTAGEQVVVRRLTFSPTTGTGTTGRGGGFGGGAGGGGGFGGGGGGGFGGGGRGNGG